MVRLLNVDVQEGCLKEAPEKGGNAQNCGGLPHRFQSITNLNFSVSLWPLHNLDRCGLLPKSKCLI